MARTKFHIQKVVQMNFQSKVNVMLIHKYDDTGRLTYTLMPASSDGQTQSLMDAKRDVLRFIKRNPTIKESDVVSLHYSYDNIPLSRPYNNVELFGKELQYEPKCQPSVFGVRCYYKWSEHCQDSDWKTDYCRYSPIFGNFNEFVGICK